MNKKFLAILLVVALAFTALACSKASPSSDASVSWDNAEMPEPYPEAAGDTAATGQLSADGTQTALDASERKLIRDADLRIETLTFDAFLPALESQIAACGGYIETSSVSGNSYYSTSYRTANVTARIPADALDGFLSQVDGMGNVTQQSLSTRDVTSQYVDIESRLAVLQDEKTALSNILQSAETTEDLLDVQKRLYDVIEEIESFEAQKRSYDSLVSYSTVELYIREVEQETPAVNETGGQELARKFKNNLTSLGEGLKSFGINFVAALPWLLFLAVLFGGIACIIIFSIRGGKKRRAKRRQAQKAQPSEPNNPPQP